MFLKIYYTVQLHVIDLTAEKPVFADKLLPADPVTYPTQASETVCQRKEQEQRNGRRHSTQRHILYATVHQPRRTNRHQRQLVDDELPGVRLQDDIPVVWYGV